jgi:hypothetical protein
VTLRAGQQAHLHQMKPHAAIGAMIGPHESRRREGNDPTDCGWTWREESVVPFGGGSYEIRIKGRLSDSLLAAFEGLTATVEPVETVLHGPVQDQSSLHGLLDRIQSLGLELVEIRRLPTSPDEAAAEPEPPP